MHRLAARLAAAVATVLIASTPVVLTTLLAAPVQAAPTCVPPDNPPPRVLSFAATDVVPGSSPTHGYVHQHFTARVDNQCGTVGCPNDPSVSCTRASLLVTAKRIAGSGAGCLHHRYTDPSAHSEGSGISTYEAEEDWTDNDADDGPTSPQLTNKCAGAYDVSVTVNNDRYDASTGTTTTTASEPFPQSRSHRAPSVAADRQREPGAGARGPHGHGQGPPDARELGRLQQPPAGVRRSAAAAAAAHVDRQLSHVEVGADRPTRLRSHGGQGPERHPLLPLGVPRERHHAGPPLRR